MMDRPPQPLKGGRGMAKGWMSHNNGRHAVSMTTHCSTSRPPVYGHPGISHTTDIISDQYWWPGMRDEIQEYIRGCGECQRNKVNTHQTHATLHPISPVSQALPFETVAMDFIVKLPPSNGYDSILTITDHDCSKVAVFIPCNETISVEEVAGLYLTHVFKRFRLPRKIISDQDPHFMGKFTRNLCQVLRIKQNMSTAFHP